VTPLVVVILAVMWVLVLVPPLLRSRTDHRPSSSVRSFNRQLSTLGRANPMAAYARSPLRSSHRPPARAGSRAAMPAFGHQPFARSANPYMNHRMSQRAVAKRRRQTVLLTLAATAFLTGVLAYGLDLRMFMYLNVLVVSLLIGFVYLLVQLRKDEEQRAAARHWAAWHEHAA
jgi:Flp pilus assembly protein TadB